MTPDELADDLERLAEELDEMMFTRLREAAAEGRGRPPEDRRLVQARRAIDKAVGLLRSQG